MARSGMSKCAHCGVTHYINLVPAVYIGGNYYCKPSCANAHRKEMTNENLDAAGLGSTRSQGARSGVHTKLQRASAAQGKS